MADFQRCDLCGAEAKKLMVISFPYEKKWMKFFKQEGYCHYADICLDCLAEIRRARQEKIKASEVVFEVREGE